MGATVQTARMAPAMRAHVLVIGSGAPMAPAEAADNAHQNGVIAAVCRASATGHGSATLQPRPLPRQPAKRAALPPSRVRPPLRPCREPLTSARAVPGPALTRTFAHTPATWVTARLLVPA